MKLDGPDRTALVLFLAAYLVLGVVMGHLLELAVYRVSTEGLVAAERPGPALLVLAVFGVGGLWGALRSLSWQLRMTRRVTAVVRARQRALPGAVLAAVARAQLGGRVDLISDNEPFSMTYGLLAPRVVLTTGLVDVLSADELRAVLEHERYHLTHLDPLKAVVARVAERGLFYLPALGGLRHLYLGNRELAADRQALSWSGSRALAGALYKVAAAPGWVRGAAASLGGHELLEARVSQIETGRCRISGVSWRAWALSAPGLGLLAWAVAGGVAALGGLGPVVHSALRIPHAHSLGVLVASTCAAFWGWAAATAYRRMFRPPASSTMEM